MRIAGVIVICILLTSFWLLNPLSHNGFETIPKKDREMLEKFCSKLFYSDQFAYVLFDEKAIAFSMYAEKKPIYEKRVSYRQALSQHIDGLTIDPTELLMSSRFEITRREIEIWKKYKHLFSSKNFLFVESDVGNNLKRLLFINKRKLSNVLQENRTIFQTILGNTYEEKKLFDEICSGKQDIMQTLHHHEGLFGILLGFGKDNSFLYHRRNELLRQICSFPKPPFQRKKLHVHGKHFHNEDEEVEYLLHMLSSPGYTVQRFCIPQFLRPVCFAAKNSKETRLLVEQYEKAQSHISSTCAGKNILHIISEKFFRDE